MTVQAIALYASPTTHPCQINSHASSDFDLNGGRSSSLSSSSASPVVGGISRLFASSPPAKYSSSVEESGSTLWHDRPGEDFSCGSFRSSSMKRGYQSPVSVLQGPLSCSSSSGISPGGRIGENISSIRSGSGGLFDGFFRHALGSYVDSDSTCVHVNDDVNLASGVVDELTFSMEDDSLELNVEPLAKDLLLDAQNSHKIFYDDFVIKAFYESEKAHRGQVRASGGPYLQHCVETAVLLASIGANSTVVAAGLLHDTLDNSFVTHEHIFQMFGGGVANLVEGVSKLSQLSKLARDNNTASRTAEADRMHTMFLAMADARAVLIKLADRLHNMMTLDALPFIKQQRFAKETLEIFAPLANRLGIYTWKVQLENLCFKYVNPEEYKDLSTKLLESFDEAMITGSVERLEKALQEEAITVHDLSGRHKSLYSVYSKMLKKKLNMDEIHDIHGLRLIVENEDDCYKALRVVHRLWPEVPGRTKDYIVSPKSNGYQSLHTVVSGEGMFPLEVQIRTKEMHLQAEYGFAAHWRYKEGTCEHSSFVLQMVEWARWVVTWQCETISQDQSSIRCAGSMKPTCTFPSHSEDCLYSCEPYFVPGGPVFVIMIENDMMSVQEFPANSTIKDLLERAGKESCRLAHHGFPWKEELRPRLNHAPVTDPTCKLQMGDVVELTPSIPDKSLVEYREEIQRMYEMGQRLPRSASSAHKMVGSRS